MAENRGLLGGIKDFFVGSKPNVQQIEQFDPQIRGNLDQILNMVMGQLQGNFQRQQQPFAGQGLLNQTLGQLQQPGKFDFAPIAAQARKGFQEQTIPSIFERFTSMGGSGGRSSALGQHLAQAGAGLEGGLASLQSQYGLQQQTQLQDLLRSLLGGQLSQQGQQSSNLMQLLGLGLQPRTNQVMTPGSTGFLPQIANTAATFGPLKLLGLI